MGVAHDTSEQRTTPAKPVHPAYFADPFVFRHSGEYFAIGTGAPETEGHPLESRTQRAGAQDSSSPTIFPLLRSPDLRRWEPAGQALVRPDPALGDTFWAPEVAFHDGTFYLYYSVGFADTKHQLRVALSQSPQGPFHDSGHALIDPQNCPFAIDASPFRDDDGQWYLFFAQDFLDGGPTRVGTALSGARLKSMTELELPPIAVLRARHDWQRFQANRTIYGAVYDWHTLEGPTVVKRGGRYYCFYSAGRWENDTYGVDYAVADHVLGPYSDQNNASGPRVLRTVPGQLIGPGHNSVVIGPDGHDWIVYHAWDPAMTARRMFLDRLIWTADGPRIDREPEL
jgi:beta-xylosidase